MIGASVVRIMIVTVALALPVACTGEQSAFSDAGVESGRTLVLTWTLFGGGTAILALVCGLTGIALFGGEGRRVLARGGVVVVGGIVFPVVMLSVLLVYGFAMLGAGATIGPGAGAGATRISVEGHRWWWRVTYHTPDGSFETANELRIPVNRPVQLELTSADVIHSFWVPAYAGKVDMIPGRTNTLTIEARTSGLRRGQCAEYCGGPHAFMSFYVEALEDDAFEEWLASERSAATPTDHPGQSIFTDMGCGACHAVRGTSAAGQIGPDLTHVGNRHSLGAGLLGNDVADFEAWLGHHKELKPGNLMPEMAMLSEQDVADLAAYLAELR